MASSSRDPAELETLPLPAASPAPASPAADQGLDDEEEEEEEKVGDSDWDADPEKFQTPCTPHTKDEPIEFLDSPEKISEEEEAQQDAAEEVEAPAEEVKAPAQEVKAPPEEVEAPPEEVESSPEVEGNPPQKKAVYLEDLCDDQAPAGKKQKAVAKDANEVSAGMFAPAILYSVIATVERGPCQEHTGLKIPAPQVHKKLKESAEMLAESIAEEQQENVLEAESLSSYALKFA